ncbi:predicted protein [Phaeodactylum tricornutum CCAP 1055/1]|uniref:Uncharacterized protein n=1 Tax=Phaeodactylum tricornutum (strain CCAP 1055/1) TaxID=556484 RepID=B7S4C3_PHATC|nr:predicted protein [Phaeodactylum tricornutum CCAP 1055/1]EEC42605.1 predicted protein [Phaeodactylum tricornutum CCAP 1055/1]|eukprot:XP_002176369.1 predicted protein [Phaeodactylum tricornutum CCAP 1055/1]
MMQSTVRSQPQFCSKRWSEIDDPSKSNRARDKSLDQDDVGMKSLRKHSREDKTVSPLLLHARRTFDGPEHQSNVHWASPNYQKAFSSSRQKNLLTASIGLQNVFSTEHSEDSCGRNLAKAERKRRRKSRRAAVKIQAIARMKLARRKLAYLQLEKRMTEMGNCTRKDIRYVKAELRRRKRAYKEKAIARLQKQLTKDAKVEENQKLVLALKDDNTNIRASNVKISTNIQNLQVNNRRLDKTNTSGSELYEQLSLHHQKVKADNEKLTKINNDYKKKVEDLEKEVEERTHLCNLEQSIRDGYEQTIAAIVARIKRTDYQVLKEEVGGIIEVLNSQREH